MPVQTIRCASVRRGFSPSPRPSPAGRGGIADSVCDDLTHRDCSMNWLPSSLSQRERAVGISPNVRPAPVAQISNLLCRRFPTCRALKDSSRAGQCERLADWKSAIQQIGNLRYEACARCPTAVERAGVRIRPTESSRFEPINRRRARQRRGVRQSSGAFDPPRLPRPKRQRTGALQNLAALWRCVGRERCPKSQAFSQAPPTPPVGHSRFEI